MPSSCADCGGPKRIAKGIRWCDDCGAKRKARSEALRGATPGGRAYHRERKRREKERQRQEDLISERPTLCITCREMKPLREFARPDRQRRKRCESCRELYGEGPAYRRREVPLYPRRLLFDRDEGICGICLEPVDFEENWEQDHVVPLSRGGSTDIENVQVAHRACNRQKANRLPAEMAGSKAARI